MSERKYAIGVDFGTESGRAVLVDVGGALRTQLAAALAARLPNKVTPISSASRV